MGAPVRRQTTLVHDGDVLKVLGRMELTLKNIFKHQMEAHEEMKGWGSFTNPYYVFVEDPVP